MNFLAHALLSFGDEALLTGNLISDFVKGKQQYDYSGRILDGIRLHRAIDEFTDTHPATRRMMEVFRPDYRLYSGPLTDLLYDHFLANDRNEVADLHHFSLSVYRTLYRFDAQLPPRFRTVLLYMERDNWLYNYRTLDGLRSGLQGLSRRASAMPGPDTALRIIEARYQELEAIYRSFFPDVKRMAKVRAAVRNA